MMFRNIHLPGLFGAHDKAETLKNPEESVDAAKMDASSRTEKTLDFHVDLDALETLDINFDIINEDNNNKQNSQHPFRQMYDGKRTLIIIYELCINICMLRLLLPYSMLIFKGKYSFLFMFFSDRSKQNQCPQIFKTLTGGRMNSSRRSITTQWTPQLNKQRPIL